MVRIEGVHKRYASGADWIHVLKGTDMAVSPGEAVALTGPSGVGKSTLLHLVAGLDTPDEGAIQVGGKRLSELRGPQLDLFRRHAVGIVYQFHFLLPEFSAMENVMLPAIAARNPKGADTRAMELLGEVGLADRAGHVPTKLSGGEQQRVAIARALMNEPGLLLADEPTGNLDEDTSGQVFDLLLSLRAAHGLTILLATHNSALASACDRTLALRDGKIE